MILGNNFIKYNYYNYILIFLLYIIFNYKYNSIYSITEEIFFFYYFTSNAHRKLISIFNLILLRLLIKLVSQDI